MERINDDIRCKAKKRGVHLYQVAYALGLNDGNFSRLLRREIPQEKRQEIFSIIDRLSNDEKVTVEE